MSARRVASACGALACLLGAGVAAAGDLHVGALTRAGHGACTVLVTPDSSGTIERASTRFRVNVDGKPVSGVTAAALRSGARSLDVALVVDQELLRSGREEIVRAVVRAVAGELDPRDRLGVIVAGEKARVREGEAGDADRIAGQLEPEASGSSVRLVDAIHAALRRARSHSANVPAMILVVTRGVDEGSRHEPAELSALAKSPGRALPVASVRLGQGGRLDDLLVSLASTSGASSVPSSFPDAPRAAAAAARAWLATRRLGFQLPPERLSAGAHVVEVVAESEGRTWHGSGSSEVLDGRAPVWWTSPVLWGVLVTLALAAVALATFRPKRLCLLVVASGEEARNWYEVFAVPLTIGAGAENDLVIGDRRVSRHHAVIRAAGRALELHDLGSANGTFVNGEPVRAQVLRDGDRIRFGPEAEFVFEIPAD